MKLLIDTCTFLWLALDSSKVSRAAHGAFLDPDNERFLSTASSWEIAIKYSRGKLVLPKKPEHFIPQVRERSGIDPFVVDERSAFYVARLPHLHLDPFDRILVAQAIVHGMTILTPDEAIEQYAVRTLW